jgi:C4-dicarboxylate-specific signal transduction histidine kinase
MPGGNVKHTHVVAEIIRFNSGESKIIAAMTDITDRKRSAEALERSEAFLAEGQHLARIGNFSWCPLTGQMEWSKPLYRIFEFANDTVLTLDLVKSRLHPDDVFVHEKILEKARCAEDHFEYEHRILTTDRAIKHLHVIAHRSKGQAGNLRYIGAIRDVTRERLAEEALTNARAQLARVSRISSLGALTASIAHEVNQPLSGIVTNASACLRMLASDPPDMEGARETARRTIRDGNRAAEVIVRLRRLFSNRTSAFEPTDLNEAAREVIALLRTELEASRVVLRTEFDSTLPLVNGDRVQIQQVIANLMRNAAEAMSDVCARTRLLAIETSSGEGNQVHFLVRDSGIGLSADEAGRIFETFYTTKHDGMGIGLSVSRSIIESHQGRLWTASNDHGQGAVFAFSLPACPQSLPPDRSQDKPARRRRPRTTA